MKMVVGEDGEAGWQAEEKYEQEIREENIHDVIWDVNTLSVCSINYAPSYSTPACSWHMDHARSVIGSSSVGDRIFFLSRSRS